MLVGLPFVFDAAADHLWLLRFNALDEDGSAELDFAARSHSLSVTWPIRASAFLTSSHVMSCARGADFRNQLESLATASAISPTCRHPPGRTTDCQKSTESHLFQRSRAADSGRPWRVSRHSEALCRIKREARGWVSAQLEHTNRLLVWR
jgi:hypothetical protein